jgi:hypothetical protein
VPRAQSKNMAVSELEDVLVELEADEEGGPEPPVRYSITSYGADMPVDSIINRMENKDLIIPEFQRSFVWPFRRACQFVESLLLGLPVPGVFLSREEPSGKLIVIDGQQRLKSIYWFWKGNFQPTGEVFSLKWVQPTFDGLTYKSLSDEDRRQFNNSIIHATVIRQDAPPNDNSSVYRIFERLNTGGMQLQPQEIRSAVRYKTSFNALLKELNRTPSWRKLFGPPHSRMRDQELILRFFALYFNWQQYTKPMKSFLDTFMDKNSDLTTHTDRDLRRLFVPTVKKVYSALGSKALKPRQAVNAALCDAVLIGVAQRLQKGPIRKLETVLECYELLREDTAFLRLLETSTSDEQNVKARITAAIRAFKDSI